MKNDRTYLNHIQEAIESIEDYRQGVWYNDFVSNKMMVDAVIREWTSASKVSCVLRI